MDKRFNALPPDQQLALRRTAVAEVLAHPEWPLPQAVSHLRRTMRLTTAELATLAGVSYRTLQDIEAGRSEGTVQTMNRLFGVLGLKLGVVRQEREPGTPAATWAAGGGEERPPIG
jgi:transcriptional regulator with XRE-family HTH domain